MSVLLADILLDPARLRSHLQKGAVPCTRIMRNTRKIAAVLEPLPTIGVDSVVRKSGESLL